MLRTRTTALLFSENFLKVVFVLIPLLLRRPPPLHITVILILSEISIVGTVRQDIDISFSSQNVNSLNLTGLKSNFDLKVTAIKNLNTDVIFLSDTRLVNSGGVNGDFTLRNAIRDVRGRQYTSFFNSSKN